MQHVSLYERAEHWEQFHSWVHFLGYWLPCPMPKCLSLLITHIQALPRGFQSFHTSGLITSSFSSGHPQLFRWAKHKKLFCLQVVYLPVYMWLLYLQVFETSRSLQGALDLLQLKSVKRKELRPAENLGHNITMICWSTFIQLLITSMMKEKHWIKWVKMNLQNTCVTCINSVNKLYPQQYSFWAVSESSYICLHKIPLSTLLLSSFYMVFRNREIKWSAWWQPRIVNSSLECGLGDHSLC